ncbi:MAG: alternative ribosome rescue aminoacyl-tRNA hydrolase ArfB [Mariprofundus sp.]|nr:alternative ribosome rescue aminoacyl-tRNA hydrolase ArfB [Mariprofundus sp.]
MLAISPSIIITDDEIDMHAIRAQGAGGQNVNKVSSAIHLRFDIRASSLPEDCKERLLQLRDRRINSDGVIIIKAQQYRSQDKNKTDALNRLHELISAAIIVPKKRRPTRKSRRSVKRRLESKNKRSLLISLRKKVSD